MKIQYLAVIFIVIVLPISMVLSYYMQTQIDTINSQTNYNTKLYSSTYDAVKAFQINTVNNRYSSVSNSKIRDIEAAVNTFYNSLSTNESLSKEELMVHVPALVFTLYDGYYIYNKYDNAYSEKDQGIPDLNSDITTYGLKPYIYYSCRYKKGTKDFVVNYTLDNAITIYGDLGSGYETLSGYLINPDDVTIDYYNPVDMQASQVSRWKITYSNSTSEASKITITPEVLTEHIAYLNEDGTLNTDENGNAKANENDFDYLVYDGKKVYYDKGRDKFFWYDNYKQTYINDETTNQYARARVWNGHLHSTSSLEYFYNAREFSIVVNQKIGDITQEHAVTTDGTPIKTGITDDGKELGFVVDTGEAPIFNTTLKDNDPLISGSTFNENRMAVIRNSITTNLAAAIANYNMYSGSTYEYALPVLDETEWGKITNEVCMISFLQGIPIGHKYYNNYCVITNNDNEEVVSKNNIYIITKNMSTGEREYHLPGCTHLMETNELEVQSVAYSNLSFIRQTLRIAEGDYQYFYPQMRGIETNKTYITACYYCIVNSAETYSIDEMIEGKIMGKDDKWNDTIIYNIATSSNQRLRDIRAAYIKALARERYDLYQMNMNAFNTN